MVPSWSCAHNVPFNTFYMQCILGVIIIIWLKKMTIIKLCFIFSHLMFCYLFFKIANWNVSFIWMFQFNVQMFHFKWIEMMIRCEETSSKHVLSVNVSRSVKEDFTSMVPRSAVLDVTALLQTATSILTLHRPFLSARYLSRLCFSGEHEQ